MSGRLGDVLRSKAQTPLIVDIDISEAYPLVNDVPRRVAYRHRQCVDGRFDTVLLIGVEN